MPQENVDVVRRLFEAVARRDAATVLALYDADVEWDGTRHRWAEVLTDVATWRGHDALRRFFGQYHEMWDSIEHDIEELIDVGEQVVAVVTTRARGRASGLDVEWPPRRGLDDPRREGRPRRLVRVACRRARLRRGLDDRCLGCWAAAGARRGAPPWLDRRVVWLGLLAREPGRWARAVFPGTCESA